MSVVAIKKTSSNSDLRCKSEQQLIDKWNKAEDVKISDFLSCLKFHDRGDYEVADRIVDDVLKKYSPIPNYYKKEYNVDEFISLMNKTKEDEKNPVENWRKTFEQLMLDNILLV